MTVERMQADKPSLTVPTRPADDADLPVIQVGRGLLDRRIFTDPGIYRRELTHVFRRGWICVGYESLVSKPGDYFTTTVGEDPIIVTRDRAGALHVLLNSCRHRGNKVCLLQRGNTDVFTCSYHNWKYACDGSLKSVPYAQGAYFGELRTEEWGLIVLPRVEVHHGLIFASWEAQGPSLGDHLGDMAWYLDHLVLAAWGGGIEVIAGPFAYRLNANWKILAENNAGDHYHTPFTHRSVFKLDNLEWEGLGQEQPVDGPFEASAGEGHGLGGIYTGDAAFERDLQAVDQLGLGAEVREFVRERWHAKQRALAGSGDVPYSASHGNVFPNFSFSGHGGALAGRGFYLQQPRGPMWTETWQCVVVERDAPDVVKEIALLQMGDHGQLPMGLFAQDDAENFERVTESALPPGARDHPFHIGMGLGWEGRWPGQEQWRTAGLPGLVGPRFSEHVQRHLYRHWAARMGCPVE